MVDYNNYNYSGGWLVKYACNASVSTVGLNIFEGDKDKVYKYKRVSEFDLSN